MTTFTALGDSITLGLGDPAPGGGWRGWAVFLAEGLPGGQLHNLATTGAQAADVERSQLPRALELRPDVASVVVGINDTLRRGFDPVRVHDALAHVIGSLSAAGAVVLTMRLPDPGRMLGMPTALARPLARRISRAQPDHGPAGGAVRHAALRRGRGQPGLRPLHVERGPAAPQRARAPAHRLPFPRPARRARPPGRAPPRHRADQPAADPPRRVHVDGDQGHEMGAAPVHGPASLPGGDGGAGLLPGAAAGAAGTGPVGVPETR